MELRKPNLFIVGAPKCGTTSLAEYFKQHEDIFMCTPKEPNFFNTDLERKYRITKKEYLELFQGGESIKYRGEATPLYLMSRNAAKLIKAYSPEAKIFIMLRNPVDLVYSAFYQNLYNGVENISAFEKAIEAENDRRNGRRVPQISEPVERLFYSEFVKFSEQIERYFNCFGKENVMIILFDDFTKNAQAVVNKAFEFLQIDKMSNIDTKQYNAHKEVTLPRLQQAMKNPSKILITLAKVALPSQKIRRSIHSLALKTNTVSKTKKPIQEETRIKLEKQFLTEVNKLEELLKIDLNSWK